MTHPPLRSPELSSKLTLVVSGASGLIGSAVTRVFEQRGNTVRRLVRRDVRGPNEIAWDPEKGTLDASALEGANAIINLSGENLAQRWTDSAKRKIRESRISATTTLSRAIASLAAKPPVFLSGSAMGIYGAHRDETLDESSAVGSDFLASVCVEWEAATSPAANAGVRVVLLRTGLVISRDGGVLEKLMLPFRFGAGGKLGSGEQWMSWIALVDYVEALAFLIRNESVAGPVNLVAPNPVTNAEFTRVLGRVLRRPALFTVPGFAMSLVMGEMAEDTVLASQRVRPRKLLEAGFDFTMPTLEAALRDELTRSTR